MPAVSGRHLAAVWPSRPHLAGDAVVVAVQMMDVVAGDSHVAVMVGVGLDLGGEVGAATEAVSAIRGQGVGAAGLDAEHPGKAIREQTHDCPGRKTASAEGTASQHD
jgi:hypothetical protein